MFRRIPLSGHIRRTSCDDGAIFSADQSCRFLLWRMWDRERPICVFVGMNPSVATESNVDPTLTRCINYARAWKYGSVVMANIFPIVNTDPTSLNDNFGSPADLAANERYVLIAARRAGLVVVAWGAAGKIQDRGDHIAEKLIDGGVKLHCLTIRCDGHPGHPLYKPSKLIPIAYPFPR